MSRLYALPVNPETLDVAQLQADRKRIEAELHQSRNDEQTHLFMLGLLMEVVEAEEVAAVFTKKQRAAVNTVSRVWAEMEARRRAEYARTGLPVRIAGH